MEVHHHSNSHGKKNLKTYIWEFLMLFFAVFCGFLAEYQLEQTMERHREKDFILSMIEDARTDTVNINEAIAFNIKRIHILDTLANSCFNFIDSGVTDEQIYKYGIQSFRHPDFVSPTERTLSQLKNSGGMRLIQNNVAADSITKYDDYGKKLVNQQVYYERYLNQLVDFSQQVLNLKYNPMDPFTLLPMKKTKDFYAKAKLLTNDKLKIIEFGNRAATYRNIVMFYLTRLNESKMHSIALIETLKREYHLQ